MDRATDIFFQQQLNPRISPASHQEFALLRLIFLETLSFHSEGWEEIDTDTFDWNLFLQLVLAHRLGAQTQVVLKEKGIVAPDPIAEMLLRNLRVATSRALVQQTELSLIERISREENMQVLPFKGLVLAETLYPSLSFRPAGDIDLLCPHTDALSIIHILFDRGYKSHPHLTQRQTRYELENQNSLSFYHPHHHTRIDLHTELQEKRLRQVLSCDHIFQQATHIEGRFRMNPLHQWIALLMHGSKHNWRGLIWLLDLALATKRLNRVSESTLSHFPIKQELATVQQLYQKLFGLELSGISTVPTSPLIDKAVEHSIHQIQYLKPKQLLPNDLRIQLSSYQSKRDQVRYLVQRFFTPNKDDFTQYTLPDALFPLYFILRPLRISIRYLSYVLAQTLSRKRWRQIAWKISYPVRMILLFTVVGHHRRQLFGKAYTRVETDQKVVSLTFDDGPCAPYTEELLRVLARFNVQATFFMVGKAIEQNPTLARSVAAAGHEVGNHSYSHARLYFKSFKRIREEISKTDLLIRKIGGPTKPLFRAPYGRSLLGVPWILYTMRRPHVLFDFFPSPPDWHEASPTEIANDIIKKTRPGSILVLHDGNPLAGKKVAEITTLVLEGLRNKDYQFVTASELIGVSTQSPFLRAA